MAEPPCGNKTMCLWAGFRDRVMVALQHSDAFSGDLER